MILSFPSCHLLFCPVRGFVERHGERFLCLLVVALNHCLVALPNTTPDNFLMFLSFREYWWTKEMSPHWVFSWLVFLAPHLLERLPLIVNDKAVGQSLNTMLKISFEKNKHASDKTHQKKREKQAKRHPLSSVSSKVVVKPKDRGDVLVQCMYVHKGTNNKEYWKENYLWSSCHCHKSILNN